MTDGDATVADAGANGGADARSYSLVFRSVREGLGSDSYLLRSYALVGSLVGAFILLSWILALPVWVQNSVGGSGTVTFSRAFLLLTGVLVLAPIFAPLIYAHRRRRERGPDRRGDALYGASGYLFVVGLYLALLISAPPNLREDPAGAIAPLVEFLYGLDPIYGVVPPVVAAVLIVVLDRV